MFAAVCPDSFDKIPFLIFCRSEGLSIRKRDDEPFFLVHPFFQSFEIHESLHRCTKDETLLGSRLCGGAQKTYLTRHIELKS